MKRTKLSHQKIDAGLYRTKYGFSVIWPEAGRPVEKHFPPDTDRETLRAFRRQQLKAAPDLPIHLDGPTGTFVRDVVKFLRTRKHRPGYKSDRSHLKHWIKRFGRFSRHAITADKIKDTLALWGDQSPKELRHRVNALRQVFNYHDKEEFTARWFASIRPKFLAALKVPKTRPKGVPDDIILAVALRLAEQQRKGCLRDGKTRARFLVLATCGQRPCQLQRAKSMDVNLTARTWAVEAAKNSDGGAIFLNDEMLAAWKAFIAADAWGAYDTVSFAKTLRRNGWPSGVRPYRMRHQTLQVMTNKVEDFGLVQGHAGHASPETTRANYVPITGSKRVAKAIEGRFSKKMFAPVLKTVRRRRRTA